ncbi:unnamed protein product [Moneuplotes crassus]|uniref:Uncharacterized protein n=1 Tax=Euplotes crassus TaxID=5936 RepID=A0AAD1Y7K5_EUPCR|nr:unnamed protein product [Moneuplotes crassus]
MEKFQTSFSDEIKKEFLKISESFSIMKAEDYFYRNFSGIFTKRPVDSKAWFAEIVRHYEEVKALALGTGPVPKSILTPKYDFSKVLAGYRRSLGRSATGEKRGGSADREILKNFKRIFECEGTLGNTNFQAEERAFNNHLHRLRRAHQIEIRNIRMKFICVIDEMVNKKFEAIQKAIDTEFSRFQLENHANKNKIKLLSNECQQLRKIISDYEIIVTSETIQDQNLQKPGSEAGKCLQVLKPSSHSRKRSSKLFKDPNKLAQNENRGHFRSNSKEIQILKDFNIDEFNKGLSIFMDVMETKLKKLDTKPLTLNQQCQAIDYKARQAEEEFKDITQNLEHKIALLKEDLKQQTCTFAKKHQLLAQLHHSKERKYLAEVSGLEEKCGKLFKELVQVKRVLRSPYLYSKYRKAKFEDFPDLDLPKSKLQKSKKSPRKPNLSLTMEKVDSLEEESQLGNLSCRTADRLSHLKKPNFQRCLPSLRRNQKLTAKLKYVDLKITDINIKRSRLKKLSKEDILKKIRVNKEKLHKRLTKSHSNNSKNLGANQKSKSGLKAVGKTNTSGKGVTIPGSTHTERNISDGRKRTVVYKRHHPTERGQDKLSLINDSLLNSEQEIAQTSLAILKRGNKNRKMSSFVSKKSTKILRSKRYRDNNQVYGIPRNDQKKLLNEKLTKSLKSFQIGGPSFFTSNNVKKKAGLKLLCAGKLRSFSERSYSHDQSSVDAQNLYNNHDVYK